MFAGRIFVTSEETWQRWRAVGDAVSNLTDPVIDPLISRSDSDVFSRSWGCQCLSLDGNDSPCYPDDDAGGRNVLLYDDFGSLT